MAEAVEAAFRYDKMVLACATYDGGLFPVMEDFLNHLKQRISRREKLHLLKMVHGLLLRQRKSVRVLRV